MSPACQGSFGEGLSSSAEMLPEAEDRSCARSLEFSCLVLGHARCKVAATRNHGESRLRSSVCGQTLLVGKICRHMLPELPATTTHSRSQHETQSGYGWSRSCNWRLNALSASARSATCRDDRGTRGVRGRDRARLCCSARRAPLQHTLARPRARPPSCRTHRPRRWLAGSVLAFGLAVGVTIADVATAPAAARQWNRAHHVGFAPTLLPAAGGGAPGVGLDLTF